jgi:hypothetical protein
LTRHSSAGLLQDGVIVRWFSDSTVAAAMAAENKARETDAVLTAH